VTRTVMNPSTHVGFLYIKEKSYFPALEKKYGGNNAEFPFDCNQVDGVDRRGAG